MYGTFCNLVSLKYLYVTPEDRAGHTDALTRKLQHYSRILLRKNEWNLGQTAGPVRKYTTAIFVKFDPIEIVSEEMEMLCFLSPDKLAPNLHFYLLLI